MKTKVQKVKQVVVSDKVINSIYQTKDYNKFSFHPSNREIKDPHVRQLVKSMREKGWIPGSTIVVNEKGEVIDGQHRLMSAMIVGIPVKYVSVYNGTQKTIGTLRNICIEKALDENAEYILFWDDDDYYDPLRTQQNVETLKKNPFRLMRIFISLHFLHLGTRSKSSRVSPSLEWIFVFACQPPSRLRLSLELHSDV